MSESAGEKSFEATQHRRQEAREQGQVAFSQDLGSALLLMLAMLTLTMFGRTLMVCVTELMRHQLGDVTELAPVQETLLSQGRAIFLAVGGVVLPIMGVMLLGGVFTSLMQVGFLFTPDRIAPDLNRLNPLEGLKRIFSLTGTMRLGFGLFKVIIIGIVAGAILWLRWGEVLHASTLDIQQLGIFMINISLSTVLWIGLALLILAIFDFALQRWKYEQDLRMTHQEVREEMKNLQGDPQIIARRRAIQRQLVLNRISSSVPKADVIVTNPTELAVAIQYDPEVMAAPVVVAKGAGVLAQRIRRLALENNIPIVERKPLAQLLYKEVDINHPVPNDAYGAVAEVLAYVYQLQGKKIPAPRLG